LQPQNIKRVCFNSRLETATFKDHGNRVNRSRYGVGVLIRGQGVAALKTVRTNPRLFLFLVSPCHPTISPTINSCHMSTNDTRDPQTAGKEFPALSSSIDKQQLVARYYSRIYSAIARLTKSADAAEIQALTMITLHQLWTDRDLLLKEKRTGVFIYKALLQEIFRYLKKHGHTERIRILRRVVPVDPACYLHIISPFKTTLYSYLLKIKNLWKIF
jgi:hypothetical protein